MKPSVKFFEMKYRQVICLSMYNKFSSDEQLSKEGFLEEEENFSWGVNVWDD
jgi:hypothetical protein